MNTFQPRSAIATVLILTLATLSLAHAAPPPKVQAANPNSALQGEALDVVISGMHFDNGSAVRFLVTDTDDDTQISVGDVTYNANGTLTASVQVQGEALISEYDIEVTTTNGRRGKGTTLFSVFSSNGGGQNQVLSTTCDDLFGFPLNTCTAAGTGTDASNPYEPCTLIKEHIEERSWKMTHDCDTRRMLTISADHPFFFGDGYRLNLVAPWSGEYAGITNSMGANRLNNVRIVVQGNAVAAGCGAAGKVQSAVYFDPDRGSRSASPRGGVGRLIIETQGGGKLCKGIEFVGSDPYIGNPYKAVGVTENYIMENSYEQVAIEMANINLSDVNDQVRNEFAVIWDNIVEASDSPCAAGIVMGPGVERPQIDGNLVYASSGVGCPARTVGIAVLGSGRNIVMGTIYDLLTARPADLNGNTVHTGGGGSIGILIDAATDAETTKSQITAGESSDYGVCVETGANFAEVGRRSDYLGNEVVSMADCGAVLP
jgi:hypothetical protein